MIILRNSSEIAKALQELFSGAKSARVAVVGFVGEGAGTFLPDDPSGIQLICWDKAGSTNPDSLRALRKKNVEIFFSDRLHMKLYWSQGRGAIIGSANLSNNGLSPTGLQELGVFLKTPDDEQLESLINSIKKVPVDHDNLRNLDRRTAIYRANNRGNDEFPSISKEKRTKPITFKDWYHSKDRKEWKLFVYDEGFTKKQEKHIKEQFPEEIEDYALFGKAHAAPGVWSLAVDMSPKHSAGIEWFCYDIVKSIKKDKVLYVKKTETHLGVQRLKIELYGQSPFHADQQFKKRLFQLLKEAGMTNYAAHIKKSPDGLLPQSLLTKLLT